MATRLTRALTTRVRPGLARRRRTSSAIGAAAALTLVGGIAFVGTTADRAPDIGLTAGSEITLIGHGYGHGRGMGQYGAYGYAKRGWSYQQILQHFYGNTTAGRPANPEIQVGLTNVSGVSVHSDAGMRVGGQPVAAGQAVSLAGNTANILSGCGGAVIRSVPLTQPFVDPVNTAPNRPANEFLKLCGSNAAYRGSLGLDGGRVINKLNVDDYVKGVIPRESIPGWADSGGMEALKAQAVVARSYALSAIAGGKKIDDTQNSQVYGAVAGEDPRTNAAADATAGQIRLQNGQPAFTEFSSSTGGYSAGGKFPAVVDDGDAGSPNHDWTATVSPSAVAAAFGLGSLDKFEVIEANGLGAENGRALKVRATGGGRSVEATGEEARTKLGLKSSWFSVQGQQTPPAIVKPPTGPAGGAGSLDLGSLGGLADQLLPGAGDLLSAATTAFQGLSGDLGGITGPLGQALGVPTLTPDGAGVTQLFQKGMMFFSQPTGAHALAGQGLARYQARGGIPVLGFPKRNVLR
ncbi:SpoIID/LytB domain-containing protein [Gordonia sp. VNQ95]|uniref:SpoIID/LytB domain-containing protein n=1 Tax=Gordonia sp. VNQ95 TaxID=3156619 RepID=UPI0032B46DE3